MTGNVHFLKPGHKTWTPPALYVLDTETRTDCAADTEVLSLRLWAAKIIDRRPRVGVHADSHWTGGTSATGLARSIDNATRTRPTLWLYAHNLAFDLATTQLPLRLVDLGWQIGDFALSGDSPWMRLHEGKRSLTLADSHSWLPASIDEIGRMLGRRKPRLPAENASADKWRRRCRADVAILAAALTELLDWHESEGRGYWSVTGTATGWNHYRTRLPERAVVIDPDPDLQAADRKALYSGRRQVWRVGTFRGRRYLEIDLVAAYPTQAGAMALPMRRGVTFDQLPLDHPLLHDGRFGVLADCEIATDTPRYPVRLGEANWYPTGRFRTALAGPEIAEARMRGELVSVGAGQVHQLARTMTDWAEWVTSVSHGQGNDHPGTARLWCKLTGRTVIGRWAGHTWSRTELGPAPAPGWNYEPGVNGATGMPGGNVDLGGRRWWVEQSEGADNAYPAVTAWVESAVRVAMGRVIDLVGPGAILAANTDGLIVAEAMMATPGAGSALEHVDALTGARRTRWVLGRISAAVAPLRLAVKRASTNVTVLGPQHVIFGAQRKLAGIPADADTDGAGSFAFHAWPSLTWQMTEGDDRGYHRPRIVRRVDGPYPVGWVLDDGTVHPPAATITPDGATRLLAWHDTPNRPPRRTLAGDQHPYLDGLL